MASTATSNAGGSEIAEKMAALNPTWQQSMLRIRDPKVSIPFYEKHFGMTLVNSYTFGSDKGNFSLYFLATVPEKEKADLPKPNTKEAHEMVFNARHGAHFLELTHNHGSEDLPQEELPTRDFAGRPQLHTSGNDDPRGFGHIAFNVQDVYAASADLEASGVAFKKRPDEGNMKGLAFALDPDGYWIELVRGMRDVEPDAIRPYSYNLSQTMIRVKDADKTVEFYQKYFNMEKVVERHFAPEKGDFSLYFLATKAEEEQSLFKEDPENTTRKMWDPCLELTHNHGTETEEGPVYHNGNDTSFDGKENVPRGFGHIGFLVDDLDQFCEVLDQEGVSFVKKPSDGSMRGIAFAKDPTGYWIELVQRNVPQF
eukprot:CAMPEP_0184549204 /NCGR_PEP_ID=MMETSP0199_2-20130426/8409_1 /TAXON_ID=1112570 /ORGANISM="Thraustochytrium sp., Strain LLF1b" /LENGTH=368 /DNA_ID=CAMNT_0026943909 /DNA_START=112 /DNA_END=1218 /DNA_ORIENTATION=+